MSRPPLVCSLAGEPVAEVLDAGAGQCALRYLDGVVADRAGRRLLSVRLPVRAETYASQHGAQVFLDGLLPEDWVRSQLAQRAHLDPDDTFGLLRRYGGDCAGAVSFRDADTPVVAPDVRWLVDDELVTVLRDLRSLPLGDGTDETVRLSLGGVQEKLIATLDGDRVGIPVGDQPSTHLLKPSPLANDGTERYPGVVHLELLCARLAAALVEADNSRTTGIGFRVPETSARLIGGRWVLVVTRYDRRPEADGTTTRLHQEDACQVLGIAPDRKYQALTRDQPSLAGFAAAIGAWGTDPLLDQRALLQLVTFTVCVGNADLHAKNLSLLHDDGIVLAPLYDVVPTATYPGLSREVGLQIGGRYHLDDITTEDLVEEATRWGLAPVVARRAIAAVADGVASLAAEVAATLPADDGAETAIERAVAHLVDRARSFATT